MSLNGRTEEICRRMASIRDDLDRDLDGMMHEARTLSSWRYYLNRYPLVGVAASIVVGYAVVPRRVEVNAPDAKSLEKLAKKHRLVVQTKPDREPKGGVVGGAFNFLFGLATRGAMAYLGHQLVGMLDAGKAGGDSDGEKSPPRPSRSAAPQPESPTRR